MIGCLKLLLNLTYNHHDTCESIRLACTNTTNIPKTTKNNANNKRSKTIKNKLTNNRDTKETDNTLGGIAVLLSLLNIQFDEDMFDVHQHVIGLLINLVCTCGIHNKLLTNIM